MSAIFDFSFFQTCGIIRNSLIGLIDTGIVFLLRWLTELLGGGNFTTTTPRVRVTKFGPLTEG